MYTILAFINGSWRTYTCDSLADLEALQGLFDKHCVEYRNVA